MTDYTIEEYHQAIREIADRLDEVRPGWRGEIDLPRLDFAQADDCLFGQLFKGRWRSVFQELGLPFYNPTGDSTYSLHALATGCDEFIADWVQVIVEDGKSA